MGLIGGIGRRVARRSRWLAQRLWMIAVAEVAWTSWGHWRRLEPDERNRLVYLARKSKGRPSRNLTERERREAEELLDKLGHIELAGSMARTLLPFRPVSSSAEWYLRRRHRRSRRRRGDVTEAGAGLDLRLPDSMEEREKLMRDYLAAWNDRDAERIASFFTEDATYEDRGAGAVLHGPREIAAHAARVHDGFADLQFELVRAAHGEDFTAGEWRSRMTHTGTFEGLAPTGRVVESVGVDVATLDGAGRIRHLASYYDGAEIMRDLGLLPDRGSRTEGALVRVASALTRLRGAPRGGSRTTPGSG